MAALGWLQNLDLAGSAAVAVVIQTPTCLVLTDPDRGLAFDDPQRSVTLDDPNRQVDFDTGEPC